MAGPHSTWSSSAKRFGMRLYTSEIHRMRTGRV